jgi:hypothetical protein
VPGPRMRRVVLLAALVAASAGAAAALVTTDAAARESRAAKRAKKPVALTVRKIVPKHGARFVSLLAQIKVHFSTPVDRTTVDADSVVLRRLLGDPVDATIEVSPNAKTVIVTPREPMQPGSDYEVLVRRTVARADGVLLKREARSIFYTDNRFPQPQWVRPDQFREIEDPLHEGRAAHSGTLLPNGAVLLAGGEVDGNGTLAVAGDVYLPQQDAFLLTTTYLAQPRAYHAAARWTDGAVLVGGWNGTTATASAEAFDVGSRSFAAIKPMKEARDFHAAVRLADGRVLVTGGLDYVAGGVAYSDTAEILASDGTWRTTLSAPLRRRAGHTLTLLGDGTVLIVGGTTTGSSTAEIFDPATETFRLASNLPRSHRQLHSATAIDGGTKVVCADGGEPIVEVYDTATERFFTAAGSSFLQRTRATASLLPGNNVLIAGGIETRGTTTVLLQSMDVYVRSAGAYGSVYYVPVVFREARAAHTATTLDDGRILFAGGYGITGSSLTSAVMWTPDPVAPSKR